MPRKKVQGPVCAVSGCTNTMKILRIRGTRPCLDGHYPKLYADCDCKVPFSFHKFPTDKDEINDWIANLSRKDFTPTAASYVCSDHFVDGKPTATNPNPTEKLGHSNKLRTTRRRACKEKRPPPPPESPEPESPPDSPPRRRMRRRRAASQKIMFKDADSSTEDEALYEPEMPQPTGVLEDGIDMAIQATVPMYDASCQVFGPEITVQTGAEVQKPERIDLSILKLCRPAKPKQEIKVDNTVIVESIKSTVKASAQAASFFARMSNIQNTSTTVVHDLEKETPPGHLNLADMLPNLSASVKLNPSKTSQESTSDSPEAETSQDSVAYVPPVKETPRAPARNFQPLPRALYEEMSLLKQAALELNSDLPLLPNSRWPDVQDFSQQASVKMCEATTQIYPEFFEPPPRGLKSHCEDRIYRCNWCQHGYVNLAELYLHARSSHMIRPYPCDWCGKCFNTFDEASKHTRIMHEKDALIAAGILDHTYAKGEEDRHCSICKIDFEDSIALRKHTSTHHPVQKDFLCNICGESCSDTDAINKHKAKHKYLLYDKHDVQCPVCNKTLSSKRALQSHLATHSDERPWKCTECDSAFKLKVMLQTHYTRLHTDYRPHRCHLCERTFSSKQQLDGHLRIHTGEKPFSCPHCGKSFRLKCNLDRHILIHTGEKPFKCPTCGRAFNQISARKTHMKVHGQDTADLPASKFPRRQKVQEPNPYRMHNPIAQKQVQRTAQMQQNCEMNGSNVLDAGFAEDLAARISTVESSQDDHSHMSSAHSSMSNMYDPQRHDLQSPTPGTSNMAHIQSRHRLPEMLPPPPVSSAFDPSRHGFHMGLLSGSGHEGLPWHTLAAESPPAPSPAHGGHGTFEAIPRHLLNQAPPGFAGFPKAPPAHHLNDPQGFASFPKAPPAHHGNDPQAYNFPKQVTVHSVNEGLSAAGSMEAPPRYGFAESFVPSATIDSLPRHVLSDRYAPGGPLEGIPRHLMNDRFVPGGGFGAGGSYGPQGRMTTNDISPLVTPVNILFLTGGGGRLNGACEGNLVIDYLAERSDYRIHQVEICEDRSWRNQVGDKCELRMSGELTSGDQEVKIDFAIPWILNYFGEAGSIQAMLNIVGIPFLGTKNRTFAMFTDKLQTKLNANALGIPIVDYIFVHRNEDNYMPKIFKFLEEHQEVIVKPSNGTFSIAVAYASTVSDMVASVKTAFLYSHTVIIERFIKQRTECNTSIIDVGGKITVLDPVLILPPDDKIYDYHCKKGDKSPFKLIPNSKDILDEDTLHSIKTFAKTIFVSFGLSHFARVDFFLSEHHQVYLNEVEGFPSPRRGCAFSLAMMHRGYPLSSFFPDIIDFQLQKSRNDPREAPTQTS